MTTYIVGNLIKVGIGALLFLGAYMSNMGLGAWRNVKLNGHDFEVSYLLHSIVKYVVLALSIGVLTIVVTVMPMYANYVGVEIDAKILESISSLVIVGAFLAATVHYVCDAIQKVKDVLSNGATMVEGFNLDQYLDINMDDKDNMTTDEAQVTQGEFVG